MIDKPHAPSCERNRDPILAVLQPHLANRHRVLEIGSGTGQHAVHFAAAMPHLVWQCSDRSEHLPGIRAWLEDASLPNTPAPLSLDVMRGEWPARGFDAAFSANTLHIMAWPEVEAMFAGLDYALDADASLIVYGPFKRHGEHTSASNAEFDADLRRRNPAMGVRDLEAVAALAEGIGCGTPIEIAMPANNRCVVWQRGTRVGVETRTE
jgi:hypothetical protein